MKFVVVLSIAAPDESICHLRDVSIDYIFDYGGNVDVVLFLGHHKIGLCMLEDL